MIQYYILGSGRTENYSVDISFSGKYVSVLEETKYDSTFNKQIRPPSRTITLKNNLI
jgi:hypothetical protein